MAKRRSGMKEVVLTVKAGQVGILTLNRPERHNSLLPEFLQAMLDALATLSGDESLAALVLQANGRSFSTGGDARGFVEHAERIEAYSRQVVGLLNTVILSLIDFPVPVVAAVHGIVTGGSMGFVLASDIVLVSPETSFTPYYSVVGPSPDGGWTALLPSIIGRNRAASVLYLNQVITAEEAVAWGLAHRIVPPERIREAALATAGNIVDKKPGSIRHTRRLLHANRDKIAAGLEAERERFIKQIVGEGLDGFREFLGSLRSLKVTEG
jgi:2-(1,2-epoxy-1,2-dihydrophenyl)acetyl-CoA isomerase